MSPTPRQPAIAETTECEILRRLKDTPQIFELIGQCDAAELVKQKRLREQFDEDLVRAAITVYEARLRAADQFPDAEHLWLNRVGLEQSTAW